MPDLDPRIASIEIAGPERIGGVRTPWVDLDGADVTPAVLRDLLRELRDGHPWDFFVYAEQILERDAHARSLWQQRSLAIDLPTRVIPASDSPRDLAIAEEVREHLIDRSEFHDLRRALFDAEWYGFSVVELLWAPQDAWSVTYRPRPASWFVPDRATGRELLLRSSALRADGLGNLDQGEPLVPGKWIVHTGGGKSGIPCRSGLAVPVAALHLIGSYVVRYWARLAEAHGMPIRWATVGAEATQEIRRAARQALRDLGHDAAAIFPSGVRVEFSGANVEGLAAFHETFARWINQEKSKLIVGQTMTSEDGSSLSQAAQHRVTANLIRNSDLRRLDDTITAQLITPWCAVRYGAGAVPGLLTEADDPEQAAEIGVAYQSICAALGRPLPIVESEARSRLGWTQPEEGDRLADGRTWGLDGPIEPEPKPEPESGGAS